MEIAALVVSCLSALFTGWGVLYSRGLKHASDRSAEAAEESAIAARETTDIDKARRADELTEAERNRVVWSLRHIKKIRYRLTNHGTESAYGVQIDTGAARTDGNTNIEEFPAGHVESYLILQAMGASTDKMMVTWHHQPDLDDEPRQQELPVD